MKKGRLKDRIRFERPGADQSFDGAGSGSWIAVAECWAEVQDMLPSRGERMSDGINVSARPARIRLAYRAGLDSTMRILVGRNVKEQDGNVAWRTDRVLQIISGPAVLGRREGLEFVAEQYSPAGNPA